MALSRLAGFLSLRQVVTFCYCSTLSFQIILLQVGEKVGEDLRDTWHLIFLSLFSVPGIGTSWLNYVLPLASILAVPFILPVRARYRRMELDSEQSPTTCSSRYGSTSDQLSV